MNAVTQRTTKPRKGTREANDEVVAMFRAIAHGDAGTISTMWRQTAHDVAAQLAKRTRYSELAIDSADIVAAVCFPLVAKDVEHAYLFALDSKNRVIGVVRHSVGSDSHTIICPRTALREMLAFEGCRSFITVHNHPSGDASDSYQDREVAKALRAGAEAVRLQLHDFLIVASDGWKSFKQAGLV